MPMSYRHFFPKHAAFQLCFAILGLEFVSAVQAASPYVVTDLGSLDGRDSQANAINNLGQILGKTGVTNVSYMGQPEHPFLYSGGVMIDLGTSGGMAWAINNSGQIVGYGLMTNQAQTTHAFLLSSDTMTDLGTLGGQTSSAHAINNHGQILGVSDTNGFNPAGFLYSDSIMVELNTFIPTNLGWKLSRANAINDNGQIVGAFVSPTNSSPRACLYSNGSVTDLGTFGAGTARPIVSIITAKL